MRIQLSDHFDYKRLVRFTLPSVLTMILTSIYGVVDGFFVSNFVGKTPFAAVNFIMPFLMMVGVLGFMFGAGGSALVAKTMGEGDMDKAGRDFSLLVYVLIAGGVVIALVSILFLRPIAVLLGARGRMLEDCVVYGRIILAALPFLMLQYAFSSFVITAARPKLGLWLTVAAGVVNIAGDALFVAVLDWGVEGAALATAAGQVVGGLVPLVYFARDNGSPLRLCRTRWDGQVLLKTCTNGSSELMSNVSMSLIGMLYNAQLMHYAGEDGVAAYGTIMYVNFIFLAAFIGYSTGVAPVISYHFGARNTGELKGLLRRSGVLIAGASAAMFLLGYSLARPLSALFTGYDARLMDMTVHAFEIYSLSFLFAGGAIFGSAFFTALNDGVTSAVISFLRTLVFQVAAVLTMPLIWGLDGIWYSIVAAEAMAVAVTLVFLAAKRKRYHYW